MADSKKAKSTSEEKSRNTGFNSSCCTPGEMFRMMEKFCGSKEGSVDCGSMMQQMCCSPRKEEDK